MNLFVLVALLCTDNGQCHHYTLDSSLSSYYCDQYFTDSGVIVVDKLVSIVETEEASKLTIRALECVQENTE